MQLRSACSAACSAALLAASISAGCAKGSGPAYFGTFDVAQVSPADGALDVPVNAALTVAFTQAAAREWINAATVSIDPATDGAFSFSADGATVTFKPARALSPATHYKVAIAAQVRSVSHATLARAQAWSFTTARSTAADTTPPAAVFDLALASSTQTSASLRWTATGNDGKAGTAAAYDLRYAKNAACPLTAASFAAATKVATAAPKASGSAEAATVGGLSPKNGYCFALRVLDAVPNASDLSNQVSLRIADLTPPAAPALTATPLDGGSVRLDWLAVGDDGFAGQAAAYDLRFASGPACPLTAATLAAGTRVAAEAPKGAGSPESVVVSGLVADTAYCFALQVSDAAGNTAFAAAGAATPDVAPPGVVSLAVLNVTASSVQLGWTAINDDLGAELVASQQLRYLAGAACPITSANFASGTPVATPAPAASGTVQTATATGLASDSTYCFALQTIDDAGNAALSTMATAVTADIIPPAAPVLTAGAITPTSIQINWIDVGDDGQLGAAASQQLRTATGAACAAFSAATFATGALVANVPAPLAAGTNQSATSTGLTFDTDYCFLLQVTDKAGNTAVSNKLAVHSVDNVAPATPQLAVKPGSLAPKSVVLQWTAVGDNGNTGTAASQELRYMAGSCAAFGPANFASGVLAYNAAPQAPGSAELAPVGNLSADLDYCFVLAVSDEAQNVAYSAGLPFHSLDNLPPATPAISVVAHSLAATSVAIAWTAVGDNGNLGTAAAQELRYAAGNCEGFGRDTFATGTLAFSAAPKAAGSAESATVTTLATDTDYCFVLMVADEAGNAAYSNALPLHTVDVLPPATPVISVAALHPSSATLSWTAVAENGIAGTAARQELRYVTGSCATYAPANFATGSLAFSAAPREPGALETATLAGLVADTDHCALLVVSDENGNSAFSNALQFHTVDNLPPGTPSISASTLAATGVTIAWTAVAENGIAGAAAAQELRYVSGACTGFNQGNFAAGTLAYSAAPAAPGVAETAPVAGLAADTDYCFLLQVSDENANSAYSNALQLHTVDNLPPGKPALSATSLTAAGVTITWTAVAENGTAGTAASQELRYSTAAVQSYRSILPPGDCSGYNAGNFASGTLVYGAAPKAPGAAESAPVTNLAADTDYCFQLKVADENGNAAYSNVLAVHTVDNLAPATPAISADTVAATTANIHWTAVGDAGMNGQATSQELRYAAGSCAAFDATSFASGTLAYSAAPKAPSTAEAAAVSGLASDRDYCFLLQISDEHGNSALSNALAVHTADNLPPARPVLTAQVVGVAITLHWTAVGDNGTTGTASAYKLSYATATGSCPATAAELQNPVVKSSPADLPAPKPSGAAESYALTGLAQHQLYCFALEVDDKASNAAVSDVLAATTAATDTTAPAAITDMSADILGSTSLALGWTAPADADDAHAASYDIRYATGANCPITAATFASATAIAQTLVPQAAGSTEQLDVSVADTGSAELCAAMTSTDAAGNVSPLSNIAIPPARVSDLRAATVTDQTADLNWTAVGDHYLTGTAATYRVVAVSYAGNCPAEPLALVIAAKGAAQTLAQRPLPAGAPESTTIGGLSPGTHYCLTLAVFDENDADHSLSPVVSVTTPDTTPPAAPGSLAVVQQQVRALHLRFNASGDNGTQGAAASYQLSYRTGAACATGFDYDAAGNTRLAIPVGSPPPASGTAIGYTLAGLSAAQHVCIALTATDAHDNRSPPSAVFEADTAADTTAPAALQLLGARPGDFTSTTAALRWAAVADDGTDATTGKVTAYDVRFVTLGNAADCSAFDYATATAFAAQPAPFAAVGATETASITFPNGAADQPACIAATALDAAGNRSAPSNWLLAKDDTPPAQPADLAATHTTVSGATLEFTAVGDDGTSGTAAAYLLRSAPGTCASFDFAMATPAGGLPAPAAAGTHQALSVSGLDYSTTYCFGLAVADALGNVSTPATVQLATPAPDTSAQIAAVRAAIASAAAAPIALDGLPIDAATVTYTKAAVAQSPSAADGAGFFLQQGANAIYVAIDPATFAGGVSPGDLVDLVPTQADWLACGASCTGANSLAAITAATGTRRASGVALPAAVDQSNTSSAQWPLPINQSPWAVESTLIAVQGTVGSFANQGDGFSVAALTTDGASSSDGALGVRLPTALLTSLGGIRSGTAVRVNATPAWRSDTQVRVGAWTAADITVGPALASVSPADGALNVSTSTGTITLTFTQPMDPATLVAQTSAGACSGNVMLAIDGAFANCIGFQNAGAPVMDASNTVATYTFAGSLAEGTRYKVQITSGAMGSNGLPIGTNGRALNGFETVPRSGASCAGSAVEISQVYGGGGQPGAAFNRPYIELHNRGSRAADLSAWSVQTASAGGSTWAVHSMGPGTSIAAGGYLLIAEAAAGNSGAALPRIDLSGALVMDPAQGKVALVGNQSALTGTCPAGAVDIVGYGVSADPNGCASGGPGNQTTALSPALAAARNNLACADSGSDYLDFTVGDPAPRDSHTPPNTCACLDATNRVLNDTGQAANYCVVQYPNPNHSYSGPYPLTSAPGAQVPSASQTGVSQIYGQLYQGGVTPGGTANDPRFSGEVGVVLSGQDPFTQGVFYPATFNGARGNNDEWQGSFAAPLTPADYQIFYRFTLDSGAHWTYCDLSGNGSNGGLPAFSRLNGLRLTVQ